MRTLTTALLFVLAALTLAGCASIPHRIAKEQAYFDQLAPATQERIKKGEIAVGFTTKDVYIALGAPDTTYTRRTAKGESEVWAYWSYLPSRSEVWIGPGPVYYHNHHHYYRYYAVPRYDYDAYERLRVIFDGGRVSAIEELPQPFPR